MKSKINADENLKMVTKIRLRERIQVTRNHRKEVQFLTTIDGKYFIQIVIDIADVHYEDIIAKLKEPKKKIDLFKKK